MMNRLKLILLTSEYEEKVMGYKREFIENGDVYMEKWEYKTIKFELKGFMGGVLNTDDFDYELNNYGDQGWELISCFTSNASQGHSRDAIAVLKRKK